MGTIRREPKFRLTQNSQASRTLGCNREGPVSGVCGTGGASLYQFHTISFLEEDRKHEFSHKAELNSLEFMFRESWKHSLPYEVSTSPLETKIVHEPTLSTVAIKIGNLCGLVPESWAHEPYPYFSY